MPSTTLPSSDTRSQDPVRLGSIHVDRVTQRGALDIIRRLIDEEKGGYVVTPNVDHVVLASRDAALDEAYRGAALSLADGQPILWMASLLGTPLPEKVSGSDLLDPLMAEAAHHGWNVFFFGATEDVSAAAEATLTTRHPGLRIVGRDTSFWDPANPASGDAIAWKIRRAGADLVVVALGCPKQELWMARYAGALGPAVAVGLGASLDFAAGAVARAPQWMAKAGLEWLYRLAREPRRLAYRYLVRDAAIVPLFLGTLIRRYLPGSNPAGNGVRAALPNNA